jgi:acyl-CoA thioester hydrolase
MSRLRQDKRRLALENYPLRFEAQPLYGDVDTNRHVNNVTVARWFEESRAQLNHHVAGVAGAAGLGSAGTVRLLDPPPGLQLLLVSIQIEYLQQVPYPSTVTVAAAVGRLGGASYAVAHALFQGGRCAAIGESVVVQARDGRPLRLTVEERAALEPLAAFDVTTTEEAIG